MTTDTSERGLERLICTALTGASCLSAEASAKAGGPGTVRPGVVHERLAACGACPFKGGMNQLWRNTLLALAVEDSEGSPYAGVHFSVVHHPGNKALEPSMAAFRQLLGDTSRFSSFSSDRIVNAAATFPALREWAAWYKALYRV